MKSKVKNLFLSLAVAFCAIFAVFGILFTAQGASVDAAADTHVNLQYADVDEFDSPEIGKLPDMYVHPVHFCYEVTEVIWMYKTGNYFSEWNVKKPFEQGTTYRVGIVLTANDGYYYDSDLKHDAAINGEVVDYRVVAEKAIVLTKDFTLEAYITTVNVSGLKTPVAGQLPDTEVICKSDAYTANVVWYRTLLGREMNAGETFLAGVSYRAEIHITANEGYVFNVIDKASGFVNGVECESTYLFTNKEFVMYQYYTVSYAPLQDVKVKLDKPLPGATPDFDAETSGDGFINDYNELGYINGIRWVDRTAGIVLTQDDEFVADREYFVSIMVEADENHEFTTDRKYVYLNDKMCIEQSNKGDRVRGFDISVRTPKEIAQVNVTNFVKPVEGNTPDYWLDVDMEGITIERIDWEVYNDESQSLSVMGENEKFVDGKTYLMSVYFKNNTDKVFATKANVEGGRAIATSVTLDGEKVYPGVGKNVEGERDPYNYMWFYCWYDCESEKVTQAVAWIETPVAGATPSYKVSIAGDELTVYSIYWSKYTTKDNGEEGLEQISSSTAFEKGETYCVFVILEVKGNRKIPYTPANNSCNMSAMVNGKRADIYAVTKLDQNTEGDPYKYAKIACWFDCNGEIIGAVDVGGIVAPVAGEKPYYDRTILGAGYKAVGNYAPTWDITTGEDIYSQKNGVSWYDVTNGKYDYVYENQDFIGGHTYRVQIALEVVGESRFAVDGEGHSTVAGLINGLDAVVGVGSMSNESCYLRLSYEFTCEKMAIESINVEIDEPVIGKTPNWTKIDSKYFFSNPAIDNEDTGMLNGIAWGIYGDDGVFTPNGGDVFKENTEYRVFIYITLKEGYIIEDVDTFEVYLNGLKIFNPMVFTFEPANILISYIFPKTDCTCTIIPVAETSATCTEDGMKAHYACEKCGTMYKDANGEELLDEGEEEYMLWAMGHKFGNWTAHNEYNNYHVGKCENCDETVEEECEYVAVFVEGPSKYSKYNGTLFACELCENEGAFYVDETSCEHILGDWQENGRMGGRHYRTCECGKGYEEADCDYAITIERAPSEYSDMRDVYLYTCKKCGSKHFEPIEGEVTTEDSVTDEETNVTVSVPENSETVLPEGTTVEANPVNTDNISDGAKEMMEKELNGKVDVISGYDIILYYKDVEIQPYAAIEVTIPMGENVEESDNMMVLYYNDVSIREVETVIFNWEDGTVTFETDHFSKYLIVKVTPNETPHEHDYGTAWESDANEHWNECACGDKANKAAHEDGNNDGKCDVCDYTMQMSNPPVDQPPTGNPSDGNIIGGCFSTVSSNNISKIVLLVGGFALVWFVIKKKSFADLVTAFKKK